MAADRVVPLNGVKLERTISGVAYIDLHDYFVLFTPKLVEHVPSVLRASGISFLPSDPVGAPDTIHPIDHVLGFNYPLESMVRSHIEMHLDSR